MLYVCYAIYLLWNVHVYPAFSHVLLTDSVVDSGLDLSFQLLHEKLINFSDWHHVYVFVFFLYRFGPFMSTAIAFNPFISKHTIIAHALIVYECIMNVQMTCSDGCFTLFSW